ncbi:competence type IV pilus minor pilin ComGG [Tetragenococcus solitarius]|uniref:Competence protein ComGG n=1 Tax=Tetragenococcus solitarius TaxID=71453 RepID=A0ABN3Y4L9_9ENTE|nr:competence type IV pilus minor pilin ComGG [Tetragenococcus solitarius]
MENGRSKKHEGGVLLTAVFTVVILSVLLLFLSENYRIQAQFTRRTREYYEIQIIKELFLTDYEALAEHERSKKGEVIYNQGTLSYEQKNDQLVFTINVGEQKRSFKEKIEKEAEKSTEKRQ